MQNIWYIRPRYNYYALFYAAFLTSLYHQNKYSYLQCTEDFVYLCEFMVRPSFLPSI